MPTDKGETTWRDLIIRRMYEVMRDGQWHDIEDLHHDLGRFIPPGKATRINDRDMKANRRMRGADLDAPRARPVEASERVRSGRRTITREIITNSSVIERDGDKVRMTGMPSVIRGDQTRAKVLGPTLSALYGTLAAANQTWSAAQVRLVAHEAGIHLTSCPDDCELLPLGNREQ